MKQPHTYNKVYHPVDPDLLTVVLRAQDLANFKKDSVLDYARHVLAKRDRRAAYTGTVHSWTYVDGSVRFTWRP